jgi:hypothetical protein
MFIDKGFSGPDTLSVAKQIVGSGEGCLEVRVITNEVPKVGCFDSLDHLIREIEPYDG